MVSCLLESVGRFKLTSGAMLGTPPVLSAEAARMAVTLGLAIHADIRWISAFEQIYRPRSDTVTDVLFI